MKKTTKKLFAVLLTALMLMSVMGMQSFAIGEPKPVSVKFTSDTPLSIAEIERYFEYEKEWYEEHEDWYDEGFSFDDVTFDLGYSSLSDYPAEFTLDNGGTVEVDFSSWYEELNNIYYLEYEAEFTYKEFVEAMNSGADTIDVTVEAWICNNLTGKYTQEDPYVFTLEKDLVDCVVKNVVPVSGFPLAVCETADYIELDNAKVLVTYGDGTFETLDVEAVYDEDGDYEYKIDDEEIYIYAYDGKGYISYLDAEVDWNVLVHTEEPFASIEITECDFDASSATLNSISYVLEWKNGKTESYTQEFDEEIYLEDYIVINHVDGFFVYVYISAFDFTDEGMIDASSYDIELSIGYEEEVTDVYSVENPNKGVFDFFSFIISWIEKIKWFFYNLFTGGLF